MSIGRAVLAAGTVATVALAVPACGAAGSRGPAWERACAAHATEQCPCRTDKDCETLWCVNGECAARGS